MRIIEVTWKCYVEKKKEKKIKYKICKSEEKRLKFFNYTVRNFSGKKGCKGGDEKRERGEKNIEV